MAAGHAVIATGRDPAKVAAAIGPHDDLLAVTLDVTQLDDAQAAVNAAVAKFGRIDVLVNNAGNFYAGFFEELSPDQVRSQIETLLFGPMNVTRAVPPLMRKQRAGLVVTISSTAGITGGMFCTAYAAAKFGVEGWMESLAPEIAAFGIKTMLVEPGLFRTELLGASSTTYAPPTIADYAERTRQTVTAWRGMDGKQGGDPAKLAHVLVRLAALNEPPARFVAGANRGPAELAVLVEQRGSLAQAFMRDPAASGGRRHLQDFGFAVDVLAQLSAQRTVMIRLEMGASGIRILVPLEEGEAVLTFRKQFVPDNPRFLARGVDELSCCLQEFLGGAGHDVESGQYDDHLQFPM